MMRPTTRLLAIASIACTIPCLELASADAGTDTPAAGVTLDCGDDADLPWRCLVVQADLLAPALILFEGSCFLIDTLEVAPWASAAGKDDLRQVTHFVVSGRQLDRPCIPEEGAVEGLGALGLELSGAAWPS